MGSVLRSFGAFQGNIWSVAPFIPVGSGENQCCPHKTRIFSKSPHRLIFKFFWWYIILFLTSSIQKSVRTIFSLYTNFNPLFGVIFNVITTATIAQVLKIMTQMISSKNQTCSNLETFAKKLVKCFYRELSAVSRFPSKWASTWTTQSP